MVKSLTWTSSNVVANVVIRLTKWSLLLRRGRDEHTSKRRDYWCSVISCSTNLSSFLPFQFFKCHATTASAWLMFGSSNFSCLCSWVGIYRCLCLIVVILRSLSVSLPIFETEACSSEFIMLSMRGALKCGVPFYQALMTFWTASAAPWSNLNSWSKTTRIFRFECIFTSDMKLSKKWW